MGRGCSTRVLAYTRPLRNAWLSESLLGVHGNDVDEPEQLRQVDHLHRRQVVAGEIDRDGRGRDRPVVDHVLVLGRTGHGRQGRVGGEERGLVGGSFEDRCLAGLHGLVDANVELVLPLAIRGATGTLDPLHVARDAVGDVLSFLLVAHGHAVEEPDRAVVVEERLSADLSLGVTLHGTSREDQALVPHPIVVGHDDLRGLATRDLLVHGHGRLADLLGERLAALGSLADGETPEGAGEVGRLTGRLDGDPEVAILVTVSPPTIDGNGADELADGLRLRQVRRIADLQRDVVTEGRGLLLARAGEASEDRGQMLHRTSEDEQIRDVQAHRVDVLDAGDRLAAIVELNAGVELDVDGALDRWGCGLRRGHAGDEPQCEHQGDDRTDGLLHLVSSFFRRLPPWCPRRLACSAALCETS